MYRIYWLKNDCEWILFGQTTDYEDAHKLWDDCCDSFPHSKVRLTEEKLIQEK